MADSLAKLTERVEALEAENSRLKALGTPGAGQGVELQAPAETPSRDAYEVRSALTGALCGRHDSYEVAGDEADRFNAEARRDGIKHRGQRMTYEVVKVRIVDEVAVREQQVAELKARIDSEKDADARARLVSELEGVESESNDG